MARTVLIAVGVSVREKNRGTPTNCAAGQGSFDSASPFASERTCSAQDDS